MTTPPWLKAGREAGFYLDDAGAAYITFLIA